MANPYHKNSEPVRYAVKSAKFIAGAVSLQTLPQSELAEIALVGRSNVGKSTLLNRLANSKDLARVSATPGHTQQLNFFELQLIARQDNQTFKLHLVDLPGFGFAKFSKENREALSKLTVEYISSRPQLKLVCLLIDSRRDPGPDDFAIRDIALKSSCHFLVITTKLDTLKRNDRKTRIAAIARAFSLAPEDVVSAANDLAVDVIWERAIALISE